MYQFILMWKKEVFYEITQVFFKITVICTNSYCNFKGIQLEFTRNLVGIYTEFSRNLHGIQTEFTLNSDAILRNFVVNFARNISTEFHIILLTEFCDSVSGILPI